MSCCGGFAMPIDLPALPPTPRAPFRLSGRFVLFAMIGFFVVVAGVNAVMMTIAIRTMPGVDVKSAYETSQRFNQEIARMRAQAERGWHVDADLRRDGGAEVVAVTFSDKSGQPVAGLSVDVRLEHPARRGSDRQLELPEVAPGRYLARLADLPSGAWTVALTARRDGAAIFDTRSRVILKD